jgi:transposase-like protein
MSYSPELRERAVRMVAEVRPDYPSDWPAICAVAAKLGIGNAENAAQVSPPGWSGHWGQAGGEQ